MGVSDKKKLWSVPLIYFGHFCDFFFFFDLQEALKKFEQDVASDPTLSAKYKALQEKANAAATSGRQIWLKVCSYNTAIVLHCCTPSTKIVKLHAASHEKLNLFNLKCSDAVVT